MISPATDGTNATLPGISRRSVHLWAAPVSYTHLDVYKRQVLSVEPVQEKLLWYIWYRAFIRIQPVVSVLMEKRSNPTAAKNCGIWSASLCRKPYCLQAASERISAGAKMMQQRKNWQKHYRSHRHMTVSYTHLDVYKRQSLYMPFNSNLRSVPVNCEIPEVIVESSIFKLKAAAITAKELDTLCIPGIFNLTEVNAPVSYTHLDVYKRQGWSPMQRSRMMNRPKRRSVPACRYRIF